MISQFKSILITDNSFTNWKKCADQTFELWKSPATAHKKTLSLTELAELLSYEERLEDSSVESIQINQNRRRSMHHKIPLNPFRATVRLNRRTSSSEEASDAGGGRDSSSKAHGQDDLIYYEADSPASFPPTPFSRARVMNRSAERVDSVMFAARYYTHRYTLDYSLSSFSFK